MLFLIVLLVGVSSLAFPSNAMAYIDPASGGYLLQLIVAAIAGAAMTLKMYWNKVSAWWRRVFSGPEDKPK